MLTQRIWLADLNPCSETNLVQAHEPKLSDCKDLDQMTKEHIQSMSDLFSAWIDSFSTDIAQLKSLIQ